MSTFCVTIKDIVCWTTTVAAEDAIATEPLGDEPTNESSSDAHH